jgi:hypothetical protein
LDQEKLASGFDGNHGIQGLSLKKMIVQYFGSRKKVNISTKKVVLVDSTVGLQLFTLSPFALEYAFPYC